VERHLLTFRGQASHAGTTPMGMRRDAGLAAAETALLVEGVAREHGGVGTCGRLDLAPGVVTAVPGGAELGVDLRHPQRGPLEGMLSETMDGAARIAAERSCEVAGEPIWRIEPIAFDGELVGLAERACAAAGGRERAMPSGALHDAAEMARHVPVAMVFCASREGISHAREEDSSEDDLTAAIEAFGALVAAALEG
jgi:N-carbamoyl-L-amino-acid hydrolase